MPITSLTCTSRQARTQRLQLDAGVEIDRHRDMAAVRRGHCLARAAGGSSRSPIRSAQFQNFEAGSCAACRARAGRRPAARTPSCARSWRGPTATSPSCRRRRADAARGEHALAFDLHHAGAAIAVRPVARLGRVAQMRDVGAVALARPARWSRPRARRTSAPSSVKVMVLPPLPSPATLSAGAVCATPGLPSPLLLPPAAPLASWP